jgi:hypothetical protein
MESQYPLAHPEGEKFLKNEQLAHRDTFELWRTTPPNKTQDKKVSI